MITHPNLHAETTLAHYAKTGADLPEQVAEAVAIRRKVSEHISTMQAAKDGAGDTLYDAIANGTTRSKEITALATTHALAQTLGKVQQRAEDELTAAITTHADLMVHELRKVHTPLVDTLARSHQTLGDMDIREDHERVLDMGAGAAAAWSKGYEADEQMTHLAKTWRSLALTARWCGDSSVGLYGLVKWDAVTWLDTNHELRAAAIGKSPWDAVRKGWDLHLPTKADMIELKEAIAAEEQRRADQLARDFHHASPQQSTVLARRLGRVGHASA